MLSAGWTVQTTRLSKTYGWTEFSQRMGEAGVDWLLLGGVSPGGMLRLYSKEQRFKLEPGWTAIYFAPTEEREARTNGSTAEKREAAD